MPVKDPTQRFSSRVENYVLYRPGYPPDILELLKKKCGLSPDSVIADIASGTGIFTRLLLENGNRAYGVEPNAQMRRAGEEYLSDQAHFVSVAGTAETTTLAEKSVDIVTAAQAAHWFDPAETRSEFARILKPGGWCVLLWNERRVESTPFLRSYEQLLRDYGTDYEDVRHEHTTDKVGLFFTPLTYQERVFQMNQRLDYAGLEGRLLSSSYTPQPDHPNYVPMLKALQQIFDAHQQDGQVIVEYNTRVFYGQLT